MKQCVISKSRMFSILDEVKNLKSDIIIIPNMVLDHHQFPPNSFLGISSNAIVTLMDSEKMNYECGNDFIWNEMTLSHIAFESRLLNPFLKVFTDSEKLAKGKLKPESIPIDRGHFKDLYTEQELVIDYETYIVNNKEVSIASCLHDKYYEVEPLYLIPYDKWLDVGCKYMIDINNNQHSIYHKDISDNPEFNQIISLKASEGGQIWNPSFLNNSDKGKYVISLTSNILNISKGDQILLDIIDDPDKFGKEYFACVFTVIKPKKRVKLTYMIKYYKLV